MFDFRTEIGPNLLSKSPRNLFGNWVGPKSLQSLILSTPSMLFHIFSSHMSRKLIQKAPKIDLGDQPNFRRLFGAVLELIWISFGGQIGTFRGPRKTKMGRFELQPCSPATSWLPAGAKEASLQPQDGPKKGSGGAQMATN